MGTFDSLSPEIVYQIFGYVSQTPFEQTDCLVSDLEELHEHVHTYVHSHIHAPLTRVSLVSRLFHDVAVQHIFYRTYIGSLSKIQWLIDHPHLTSAVRILGVGKTVTENCEDALLTLLPQLYHLKILKCV